MLEFDFYNPSFFVVFNSICLMTFRLSRSVLKAGIICCGGISLISFVLLLSAARLKDGFIEIRTLASQKYSANERTVKRSLPAEGKLVDGPLVVIYNRIPKTGSTTFANVAYSLASKNHFSVVHVNISHNSHVLSLTDQLRFCSNLTNWSERQPGLYHGHFAFINFERFGSLAKFAHFHPVYINLIREPFERLISYFYFLRHGDDFRPGLRRRKAGRNDTFDECVAAEGKDCEPRLLWKQIPFFCGQAVECWEPGNPWALEQAKTNLVNHYLAVGTVEHMRKFIRLVEALLPRYFDGAMYVLESGQMGGDHLRRTTTKIQPSNVTIEKFKRMAGQIWRLENEFYEFAQRHFLHSYNLVFGSKGSPSAVTPLPSQFRFEKIRPKKPPMTHQ